MSCLQASPVPADDVTLMGRTRKHPDSAGANREDGVLMAMCGESTAGTLDSAGRTMFQYRCALLGGQPTDRAELI
jgi:hypothetical protein